MTPLSELTDTELCLMHAKLTDNEVESYILCDAESNYLEIHAAEILFSEGMAGKITDYFDKQEPDGTYMFCRFWDASDNNGTLQPRKIIEVFISMEDE